MSLRTLLEPLFGRDLKLILFFLPSFDSQRQQVYFCLCPAEQPMQKMVDLDEERNKQNANNFCVVGLTVHGLVTINSLTVPWKFHSLLQSWLNFVSAGFTL